MSFRPNGHHCFHCDQTIPDDADWTLTIDNVERKMCCAGCYTVAQMLVDNDLTDYYQLRTNASAKPDSLIPDVLKELDTYKQYDVLQDHVSITDAVSHIDLAIDGITCAACAWVIERRLLQMHGVMKAQVNAVTRRLDLRWEQETLDLNDILTQITSMGFKAFPYQESLKKERFQESNRTWLLRIGVAALCTMQVMMISIGLYLGYGNDLSETHQNFMRWVSAVLTLPVISFAARPFIQAAWTSLKHKQLGIDVPVSIAISVAYVASLYFTVTSGSEVYFDSICMFTLFLLVGRYVEHRTRFKMAIAGQYFQQWIPQQVLQLDAKGNTHKVPLHSIKKNSLIFVGEGDVIPVDGYLEQGHASVDQAFLTGEFEVVAKQCGDVLLAGSVNVETPIQVRAEEVGQATQWAQLLRLQEQAEQLKPNSITVLDGVARWFVMAVILIACGVAFYWWQIAPDQVLPITLSVLIISCPCALSLAAPTALTCATKRLSDLKVMVLDNNWIENLTQVKHIVFDKTGTITKGKLSVEAVSAHGDYSVAEVSAIASALEQGGNHPVALALSKLPHHGYPVVDRTWVMGNGCFGEVNGQRVYLGHWAWVKKECRLSEERTAASGVYLATDKQLIGHFEFSDRLRTGAKLLIEQLHELGYETHLLSGDASKNVGRIARQIGFQNYKSQATPEEKMQYIHQFHLRHQSVLMIGDGLNDAAVMASASASLAMGGGVTHAKESAGAILSSNNISDLVTIIKVAQQSKRLIKQNIAWAIGYNLGAVPFAAMGMVPPWLAAIGMTLSSILVLFNAMRLLNYTPNLRPSSETSETSRMNWIKT